MSATTEGFTGPIILIVTLVAKAGKANETAEILRGIKMIADSNKEPGCLTYQIARYGNSFVVFEEHADQAAVQAHQSPEMMKKLATVLETHLTQPPSTRFYTEL